VGWREVIKAIINIRSVAYVKRLFHALLLSSRAQLKNCKQRTFAFRPNGRV